MTAVGLLLSVMWVWRRFILLNEWSLNTLCTRLQAEVLWAELGFFSYGLISEMGYAPLVLLVLVVARRIPPLLHLEVPRVPCIARS